MYTCVCVFSCSMGCMCCLLQACVRLCERKRACVYMCVRVLVQHGLHVLPFAGMRVIV